MTTTTSNAVTTTASITAFLFYLHFLEEDRGREKNIYLLFHLAVHFLAASYMCPEQRLNLHIWCIRAML